MFGSVPLKTYLPDGDIDLSVFQAKGHSLRDSWATQLSSVLEAEQRDPYAPFAVRDVQVIHAEVIGCSRTCAQWLCSTSGKLSHLTNVLQVKLLKCLVDNVVVDISFETLGGLCTVAFLEAMDRHIGSHHLFKRSVILVCSETRDEFAVLHSFLQQCSSSQTFTWKAWTPQLYWTQQV